MSGNQGPHEGERTHKLSRSDSSHAIVTALWEGGSATKRLAGGATCVVGRGDGADLIVDHRSVSRRHVSLAVGDHLMVEDLGSSNGTRVRGKSLRANERVAVSWGEPIEVGSTIVIVRPPKQMLVEEPTSPHHLTRVEAEGAMAEATRLVALVAPTDISVLLLGETGVGKGHLAQEIHARSKRASGAWLHLNCAALPEALLEGELFGYERGAFTGATQAKQGLLESASGGTVFLDEVGDLPLSTQAKLLLTLERREVLRLGALKSRPFDVRFVSATNRNLEELAERDAFRADLYYRLAGLPITIPPLRHRRDEIIGLAKGFIKASCLKLGRSEPSLGAAALAALEAHDWPGNVRELATVIERALLFSTSALEPEHFALRQRAPQSLSAPPSSASVPAPIPQAPASRRTLAEDVGDIERRRIIEALETCGGSQVRAAELLGISRRTLISRMETFGLPRPRKK